MKKLLGVLGIAAFSFQSNFWNGGNKHVKLEEADLQKIEDALEKTGTEEDATALADLQTQVAGFEATETVVEEALSNALILNGMEIVVGQSVAEAITALGAKCKEYGTSKDRGHQKPENDGKEKPEDTNTLVDGFYDPTAAHNQID